MPTTQVCAADTRELQIISDCLAGSRRIVVVTGAGISTSCGIPDFRSKDGLYDLIRDQYHNGTATDPSTAASSQSLIEETDANVPSSQDSSSSLSSSSRRPSFVPVLKGQDLFDSNLWKSARSTQTFYTFITNLRRRIRDEVHETSSAHKFIRALRDGGRLVRNYTQNIDGLEAREGLTCDLGRGKGNKSRFVKKVLEKPRPSDPVAVGDDCDGGCEVVQLHGDLEVLRCGVCHAHFPWDENEREEMMRGGVAPQCDKCAWKTEQRQAKGMRGTSVGGLRPNVVLYGEDNPQNHLLASITEHDLSLRPDALLVMGTSLKVHGLKKLVREFAKAVHSANKGKGKVIFVNRTKPSEAIWNEVLDYYVQMDCDDFISELKVRREDLWTRQGEPRNPATKKDKKKRKIKEVGEEGDVPTTPKKPGRPRKKIKLEIEEETVLPPAADQLPTPPPSGKKAGRPRLRLNVNPPNILVFKDRETPPGTAHTAIAVEVQALKVKPVNKGEKKGNGESSKLAVA